MRKSPEINGFAEHLDVPYNQESFLEDSNHMNIPGFDEIVEQNDQTIARANHLRQLDEILGNAYPNRFARSRVTGGEDTISAIVSHPYISEVLSVLPVGERPDAELKESVNSKLKELGTLMTAGRLATPPRLMGKAAFVHLSDGIERLQIYSRKDDFGFVRNTPARETLSAEESWNTFGLLDHGDFIGVEGFLFVTNTGELSIHVERIVFLAKAMSPMPDKMHGIADAEIRQRRRYADLPCPICPRWSPGRTCAESLPISRCFASNSLLLGLRDFFRRSPSLGSQVWKQYHIPD